MGQSTYDPSAFPPFAVTADVVVFTIADGVFSVVLVERGAEPFMGHLAIPGGFVKEDEDVDAAAARELREETALTTPAPHLAQLGAYGAVGRDPRMRVVTVVYWAIVPQLEMPVHGSDAAGAGLYPVARVLDGTLDLAFDHHRILGDAVEVARRSLETEPTALRFCDEEFTLQELRSVYEAVWGVQLDPGNFTRKVLKTKDLVVPTGRFREGAKGRPPELYRTGDAIRLDLPFRQPPVL